MDIQPALTQGAGIGRYARVLAENLGRAIPAGNSLSLFYFDFSRRCLKYEAGNAEVRAVRWCPGRVVQQAWKLAGWPPFDWFAGKADVYHFPNFIIPPLRSGRTVVTIHDASFVRLPELAEARNLRYLSARIADTIRRADAVITDSRFSADEFILCLSGVTEDEARAKLEAIQADIGRQIAGHGEVSILATVGILPLKTSEDLQRSVQEILSLLGKSLVQAKTAGAGHLSVGTTTL